MTLHLHVRQVILFPYFDHCILYINAIFKHDYLVKVWILLRPVWSLSLGPKWSIRAWTNLYIGEDKLLALSSSLKIRNIAS